MKKAIAKVKAAAGKASDKVRKVSADINKRRVARNVAKGNVEKAAKIAGKPGKRAAKVTARGASKANKLQAKADKLTNKAAAVTTKTVAKAEKINPTPKPKATTPKKAEQTFGQAFKQARKTLGAGKTFTYKGKKYTTNTADDLKKGTQVKNNAAGPKNKGSKETQVPFKKLRFGRRK